MHKIEANGHSSGAAIISIRSLRYKLSGYLNTIKSSDPDYHEKPRREKTASSDSVGELHSLSDLIEELMRIHEMKCQDYETLEKNYLKLEKQVQKSESESRSHYAVQHELLIQVDDLQAKLDVKDKTNKKANEQAKALNDSLKEEVKKLKEKISKMTEDHNVLSEKVNLMERNHSIERIKIFKRSNSGDRHSISGVRRFPSAHRMSRDENSASSRMGTQPDNKSNGAAAYNSVNGVMFPKNKLLAEKISHNFVSKLVKKKFRVGSDHNIAQNANTIEQIMKNDPMMARKATMPGPDAFNSKHQFRMRSSHNKSGVTRLGPSNTIDTEPYAGVNMSAQQFSTIMVRRSVGRVVD